MKKQLLFIAFMFLFVCHMCSCNDDGTGEGRDPKAKVLIDKEVKPLNKRYAAVGISAWVFVSAVGIIGHKYVNRKR